MTRYVLVALALSSLVPACVGMETDKTPIVPIRNMYNQPRWDTQEKKSFFEDQRSMRPEVEGVVSREMEPDLGVATGRESGDGDWLLQVPDAVIERNGGLQKSLTRGQERYNVYCAPCHSIVGDGLGMVARRAQDLGVLALKPPTFHSDRIRRLPDGQIFGTISNGVRNMPGYYYAIPTDDRWSIVLYLRALQLSPGPETTAMNVREQSQ